MIEKEKFAQMKFETHGIIEKTCEKSSYRLPQDHALSNKCSADIRSAISNTMHDVKDLTGKTITDLISDCNISHATYKAYISGKGSPTRPFIAKLCVGLKLSLKKANELFRMHSGELNITNDFDAITYYAIVDKDDIFDYLDELEDKIGEII